jgi:peptidoglycan L-alanyl-D-glutamate endopeptidase CwlK
MREHLNRSLKNMEGLHPDLIRVLNRALQTSQTMFVVTEGLRSPERQKELKRIGATKTLKSRHLKQADGYGHAFDFYAYVDTNKDGKITFFEEMANVRLMLGIADSIKKAAVDEKVSITYGGDWRKFKDYPHFELNRAVYPGN